MCECKCGGMKCMGPEGSRDRSRTGNGGELDRLPEVVTSANFVLSACDLGVIYNGYKQVKYTQARETTFVWSRNPCTPFFFISN